MGTGMSVFLMCIASVELVSAPLSPVPMNQNVAVQSDDPASGGQLPFMARYKATQVKTLPNSGTTTDEITEVIAVDSQGRRMTAITKAPTSGDEAKTDIKIFDPVAHTTISWLTPGTVATVSAIPIGGYSGCSYMTFEVMGPTVKTTDEDLGTATIQGVEAHGQRSTKTMTLVPHEKNPTLLNMVELWKAVNPELGGLLVRYVSDNRESRVKTTLELVSFRQSAPPPSIFRLPPGYQIVNREVSPSDCSSMGEIEPLPPPAR